MSALKRNVRARTPRAHAQTHTPTQTRARTHTQAHTHMNSLLCQIMTGVSELKTVDTNTRCVVGMGGYGWGLTGWSLAHVARSISPLPREHRLQAPTRACTPQLPGRTPPHVRQRAAPSPSARRGQGGIDPNPFDPALANHVCFFATRARPPRHFSNHVHPFFFPRLPLDRVS